ncbi:MAG: hypothetical protein WA376_05475, partial [Terrimicrobiaceae bacterium]
ASSGTSAGPALVFEPYNGTVFYAEDPDAQWFPASLTKLMTAYVTFQALKAGTVKPDTTLMCSKEATEQAPSKLWLKVGESITLDVALKVSPSSPCVVTTNATTWLKSTSVSCSSSAAVRSFFGLKKRR